MPKPLLEELEEPEGWCKGVSVCRCVHLSVGSFVIVFTEQQLLTSIVALRIKTLWNMMLFVKTKQNKNNEWDKGKFWVVKLTCGWKW